MADHGRRTFLKTAGLSLAAAALPAAPLRAENAPSSLRHVAESKGLQFGTMVTRTQIDAPEVAVIARREMTMLVPGLELKWEYLNPEPGRFNFEGADQLFDAARRNQQRVRGHTLVWHEGLPQWFQRDAATMDVRRAMESHIRAVCRRYAGRVQSWDVVNEAIEPYDRLPGGLRKTPFLQAMGRDYLEIAFNATADADPQAQLVLNEYGLELANREEEDRRNALLELLNGLVRRRVPVHALGIQSHLTAGKPTFDPAVFRRFVRSVQSLGLDVYLTELDVSDRLLGPDPSMRDAGVADALRTYLNTALQEPAVKMVILWGLSDRYTWMNDNRFARRTDGLSVRGHPLDDAGQPKPAWYAIVDALRAAPPRRPLP